ncbi:ABC-type oligopeptide transporter ABCB9-like [Protopterus annectens]|uniref:ABC-type oligopeptide transporter ABCB9-like n=1 Tax=Protopterus annectens TaxID=7888 RepID=UPI001CFACB1A|nr:ABC-type oligopeptide transporter ABCB9-like [Protopterus annectens]
MASAGLEASDILKKCKDKDHDRPQKSMSSDDDKLVVSQAGASDITSRITTDTNTMSEALSERLSLLMWYFMRSAFLLAFMFGLSWNLSVFTIIGLPIIMVIPELSGKFYQICNRNLAKEVQEFLAKANDVAVETFSSIKTVQSFANEDGEAERYSKKLQETYKLNKKEAVAYVGFMWTNSLSSLALKVSILYYGGRLVSHGDVSSGDLVAFDLYEMQLSYAVEALLLVYPNVKKAVGASEKIFEYMDRTPKISRIGTLAPESLTGHIEFNNVSFSYPNRLDTVVLKKIYFELKPGEITALVGPSGGGKSTCVFLLERFYDPVSGEILLDGTPVDEYEHKYFHSKVVLVSQEPVLFARSVEENIAYGLEKTSEDAIVAAKQANAHAFTSTLKDGYETGGKKKALYNGEQKKNILVIAHCLSTVKVANKIIVVDKGEIVEQGTHEQLLEKKGKYFQLVEKQFQGYEKNSENTELCESNEES